MSNNQCPTSNESRRGVALIIVLGFLSIMVMMAVAFLTQARVERMVADTSLEAMRTRQLAQSAIAAGMQDYLNAYKELTSQSETTHNIYLSGDMDNGMQNYYGPEMGDDRLLIGKVEDWLLDEHLAYALDARGPEGTDDLVSKAKWIWVRETPGSRTNILGRYAFACFDMSGLLDANLLGSAYGGTVSGAHQYGGDPTNRNNVRKILLDAAAPRSGYANQLTLFNHQDKWKGFDTPAALLNLTDGDWNDGRNEGVNRWTGTDMDESANLGSFYRSVLSSYSYSVLHAGAGSSLTKKFACSAGEIEKNGSFEMNEIDGNGPQSYVFKALQDYENGKNDPPVDVNYPSVKDIPMFNEVDIQVEFKKNGDDSDPDTGEVWSTYDLSVKLTVEFWYPFPSVDNQRTEQFRMDPSFGADWNTSGLSNIWIQLQGLSAIEPRIRLKAGGVGDRLDVRADFNLNKPYSYTQVITARLRREDGSEKLPQDMRLRVGYIRITKENPLTLKTATNERVDQTPNDTEAPGQIEYFFQESGGIGVILESGGITPTQGSWEVKDPRLNFRHSAWQQRDAGDSWDSINRITTEIKKNMDTKPGDYFYCRNAPMLSPAELGYIPTTEPWETLNIFTNFGIQLMNRLVCDNDVMDLLEAKGAFLTNGTINPYTHHTNVLNAAFYGIDFREVPNMPGEVKENERLQSNNLKDLVDEILMAQVVSTNSVDGHAGWGVALGNNSRMADLNKNNRISLMRNTWGLFNESDRLIVVVAIAQAIKEGPSDKGNWDGDDDDGEDVITGERRAVALCWLDGSTEGAASLSQEMNIIMFQYLNE